MGFWALISQHLGKTKAAVVFLRTDNLCRTTQEAIDTVATARL